ncbi:MAG: hypothetical protein FRX48_07089 [Lasallia pustulata]|uniref:FHA domain-containing protein n=1 Tax=Lasallia pustulata TaxID=136370 RepID=A0A5M8PIR9_9LECA|nr:MAG: hypothetical protein FRX48_07089 [Lasallia pustulata]
MADHDPDRRERRRRRSRSYSSEPHDSKTRQANDPRRTKAPGRERDRAKHHDDKYPRRRADPPRRRSYSPDPPHRKRHRSYSQDRDSTKRRRSPHDDHPRPSRPRRASRSRSRSRPPRPAANPSLPSAPQLALATPPTSQRPRGPLPSQAASFSNRSSDPPPSNNLSKRSPPPEKQTPNFLPTGKLATESNTVAGTSVVLKYHEPPDARLPPAAQPWRLYVFKGAGLLSTLELASRSCWLFGREKSVVDVATEHPSCSGQHAVVQFRYRVVGEGGARVRPYVMDLESANGTRVNGEGVPGGRFVEAEEMVGV